MCSASNHNIEFGKTLKAVLQARRAGLRVIQQVVSWFRFSLVILYGRNERKTHGWLWSTVSLAHRRERRLFRRSCRFCRFLVGQKYLSFL